MWCWRRTEKISWTDYVRNEEVLLQVNEQRNILHAIRKGKDTWIGHILRRNCLLKHVSEGKIKGEIEVTRRQGRRRKELLDDLKDRRGYSNLKEEALDRNMWRDRFGRGFEPVVRLLDDDDESGRNVTLTSHLQLALSLITRAASPPTLPVRLHGMFGKIFVFSCYEYLMSSLTKEAT